MYRKKDETLFLLFTILANILAFAALFMILAYHFYEGRAVYRDLSLISLALSVFCKFQILLAKVYILEIRVINLMNVGHRPGKISLGMGNVAIVLYSVVFWLSLAGAVLAFLPAQWRP